MNPDQFFQPHYARKLIVAIALLLMTLCSWFSVFDVAATKLVDQGLQRAFVSFASARALNAAISFGQGTEVAFQPMGVGVTIAPGQLLDPINDLVENFSDLMMTACIALGAQKLLINMGGHWLISLLLTLSAMGWAWWYFKHQVTIGWLSGVLIILFMIRFAIPLVSIGTDMLSQKYLIAEYAENQKIIEQAPKKVTEFKQLATKDNSTGLFAGIKNSVNGFIAKTKETVDVETHYKRLQLAAEQWAKHIINLIVIFLLQTLVIPVLLIWILYATAKGALFNSQDKSL